MKALTVLILLSINSVFGQTTKPTKDFNLKGSWTISSYTFADVTAMTDKIATEWKGKKATVAKVIHFPYYEIPSYKSVFEQSYCGYIEKRHLYPDTIVSTEKYFEQFKINYNELGLNKKTIRIVRTNCESTPFKEMVVKNDNEIIIFWDGTFFTLTRDKK
jgi:hypothetical protein